MKPRSFIAAGALVVLLAGVAAMVRPWDPGPIVAETVLAHLPEAIAVDSATSRVFLASVSGRFAGGWFTSTGGAFLDVIDTRTGALVSDTALTGSAYAYQPALAVDRRRNRVLVVGQDGTGTLIDLVDARNGRLLRTVHLSSSPTGALGALATIDEQRGRLYTATSEDTTQQNTLVNELDIMTGRVLGVIRLLGSVAAMALDGRGNRLVALVNVTTANGRSVGTPLYIVNARSGRVLHTVAIGMVSARRILVDERASRALVPAFFVRAGSFSGSADVVNLRTGRVVRRQRVPNLFLDAAVDGTRGRFFAGDSGPLIFHPTVTYGTNGAVSGRATRILVTGPGQVFMLDARSGRVLRVSEAGTVPAAVASDERAGRVYVMNAGGVEPLSEPAQAAQGLRGSVSVLDTANGVLLRTIPLSKGVSMMGLDERAGRVIVVSPGGSVSGPDAWSWVPAWLRRHVPFLRAPARRSVPASVFVLDPSR